MQVLSCEICEIFRNNYFEEHLRTTASEATLPNIKNTNMKIKIKIFLFPNKIIFYRISHAQFSIKCCDERSCTCM